MVPPSPDVLPEGGLGSEAKGLIPEPSRVHGCVEDPNDTPGGVIPVDAIDDDTLSIDAIDTGYGKASKPRALSGSSRGRSPGPLHVDHSSDERRALFIAAHQLKASTTGQKNQQHDIIKTSQFMENKNKKMLDNNLIQGQITMRERQSIETHGTHPRETVQSQTLGCKVNN